MMYSERGFAFHNKDRRSNYSSSRQPRGHIEDGGAYANDAEDYRNYRNTNPTNGQFNRGQAPTNFDQPRFSSTRRNVEPGYSSQGGGRGRLEGVKSSMNKNFCNSFALTGNCKYGSSCMYRHEILRVSQGDSNKEMSATCCEVATLRDGQLEIYVASKEKDFNRLAITKDELSGKPKVFFKDSSTLDASVLSCVFHEDCLFCGLQNGNIIVLHTLSWQSVTLEGHKAPVYALLFIDNILVSGDWEGEVKLWEFDNNRSCFSCVKTIQTECKITCMKELSVASSDIGPARSLWVGGTVLLIIDLASLSIVKEVKNHRHLCVSLVKFQEVMVVGFATGIIKIFSLDGKEVNKHDGAFLSCLEGMLVRDVPLLLYGTDRGYVHVMRLPELEELGSLKSQKYGNVGITKITNLGEEHFLTCAADGRLNIWKWALQ